ncbi:MAG: ABC transporter permease [Anaerolineaceae bacterium]|nr:ABC transporter permease [Anaerolineaceae bacterium]
MMQLNQIGQSIARKFSKGSASGRQMIVLFSITMMLLITGVLVNPKFLSPANIGNILAMSSLLGFVAAGQTLVILSGGEGIDLSVGSVMSMGAVLAAWFINGEDANLLSAFIIVLSAGAFFGIINSIGILITKIPPLVMTLAMTSVLTSLQQIFTGGHPKGVPSELAKAIGTGRIGDFLPWLAVLWIAEIILLHFLLRRTAFGRQLYASGNNYNAAILSGVRGKLIRSLAYVMCSVLSAFAGFWLCAYNGVVYVDTAASFVMPSVAAVVIGGTSLAGGRGSNWGTVIGAIILTVINSLLVMFNTDEIGRLLINGMLLLVLLAVYTRQPSIRQ